MKEAHQTECCPSRSSTEVREELNNAAALLAAIDEMLEMTIRHPQVAADDVLARRLTHINQLAAMAVQAIDRLAADPTIAT